MLRWLRQRAHERRTACELYGSILSQARTQGFYRDLGTPDTVVGRFEMLALHVVLVLQRLQNEGEPGQRPRGRRGLGRGYGLCHA